MGDPSVTWTAVPADYDGDGKTDVTVFRPATGIWFALKSTAGNAGDYLTLPWGVSTDNVLGRQP